MCECEAYVNPSHGHSFLDLRAPILKFIFSVPAQVNSSAGLDRSRKISDFIWCVVGFILGRAAMLPGRTTRCQAS